MNLGRVWSHAAPQTYGRVMTHMHRSWEPFHDRARTELQSDHLARANVGVVEEAGEVGAEKVGKRDSQGSCFGPGEDDLA